MIFIKGPNVTEPPSSPLNTTRNLNTPASRKNQLTKEAWFNKRRKNDLQEKTSEGLRLHMQIPSSKPKHNFANQGQERDIYHFSIGYRATKPK